jgi:HEAT repeat protein
MQGILNDPEVSGRAAAALLLAQRNDPATLQALKRALIEDDSSLRAAAIHTLALTGNQAFKKDIAPLLADDKEKVRLRAAAGYLRLSPVKRSSPGASPAAGPRT